MSDAARDRSARPSERAARESGGSAAPSKRGSATLERELARGGRGGPREREPAGERARDPPRRRGQDRQALHGETGSRRGSPRRLPTPRRSVPSRRRGHPRAAPRAGSARRAGPRSRPRARCRTSSSTRGAPPSGRGRWASARREARPLGSSRGPVTLRRPVAGPLPSSPANASAGAMSSESTSPARSHASVGESGTVPVSVACPRPERSTSGATESRPGS